MFPPILLSQAEELIGALRARNARLACAESCTGGLFAALLTEIPRASSVFERGFVVYSNAAKSETLGVPAQTVERFGAVSAETAHALTLGVLARSPAEIAVSITGVAGPDGGTPEKPVGTVWFAGAARHGAPTVFARLYGGLDRAGVRRAAIEQALALARTLTDNYPSVL